MKIEVFHHGLMSPTLELNVGIRVYHIYIYTIFLKISGIFNENNWKKINFMNYIFTILKTKSKARFKSYLAFLIFHNFKNYIKVRK